MHPEGSKLGSGSEESWLLAGERAPGPRSCKVISSSALTLVGTNAATLPSTPSPVIAPSLNGNPVKNKLSRPENKLG